MAYMARIGPAPATTDPAVYEAAQARGWRRSGRVLYRNACPGGCRACVPIRIDALSFKPSRSQRRTMSRNAYTLMRTAPLEFSEERYRLYRRYLEARHQRKAAEDEADLKAYMESMIDSPLPGLICDYFVSTEGRETLAGTGYLDVLPDGLSSVYFAFDPAFASLSLGVYSILREIELVRELGKRWYYLGFWVEGYRKMAYKAAFRPHQLASDGIWHDSQNVDTEKASVIILPDSTRKGDHAPTTEETKPL
jgi:arginine-tRNA-protein transferase